MYDLLEVLKYEEDVRDKYQGEKKASTCLIYCRLYIFGMDNRNSNRKYS